MARGGRGAKYGAVPTTVDGHRFASRAEAARYAQLRLLERAREVTQIEVHPRYRLVVNGTQVCTYEADFAYYRWAPELGIFTRVVEDVKGVRTPVFNLKAKLMQACLGITVEVVGANTCRT